MHSIHLKYLTSELSQPTLNVLRTLILAYTWAIILTFFSKVIAFPLLLTINRRHRWAFYRYDQCENAKHDIQKMLATQYTVRVSAVHPRDHLPN